MIDPCCDRMRSFGRDHYPGVQESDLPDAMVEVWPESGGAILFGLNGVAVEIRYCPWCGASLGVLPNDSPKWETGPDDLLVENAAICDASLRKLRTHGFLKGYALEQPRVYRSPDGTLTCRISGIHPECGLKGRFIRRQMPSGEIYDSVQVGVE